MILVPMNVSGPETLVFQCPVLFTFLPLSKSISPFILYAPPRAEPTRAIAPLLFSFFKLFSTVVMPMPTFSDKPLIVMRGSAAIASRIFV
jgi:hypothetical protein